MEHSQIIAEVERAFDAGVASLRGGEKERFSKDEITARVLGAYPDVDRKRLARCVDIVWKWHDPCIDSDEWDAEWEQLLAGVENAPLEEAQRAMSSWLEEKRAEIKKAQLDAYVATLECRVIEQHLIHGDKTTLADVVRALGVDGYVAALEAELLKDGYKEHQIGGFLASVRRGAVEILKQPRA